MSDIYSKKQRSQIMSKISGKDTRPEIMVRKFLFSQSFRYRKNDKRYPGKPDIVLPKYKVVVMIHGCFWHGHNCKAGKLPKTNRDFWEDKIQTNIERDRLNNEELTRLGWQVITVWQCELKNADIKQKTFAILAQKIRNNAGKTL